MEQTQSTLEKEPDSLLAYDGPDRVVWDDELRKKYASLKKPVVFDVGLGRLNSLIQGVCIGELIAIGGPTKNGKTLLAQTLTRNLAEAGAKSLWFTFEVPMQMFLEQLPAVVHFCAPLELKGKDIRWLFKRITEARLKYGINAVFIDNLHHLLDLANSRNVSIDIGHIIRMLKRIAVFDEIVIFILCHSRKPAEISGLQADVSEWDLRDSSFIPQEADSTWMIRRKLDALTKKVYTDKSYIKVCNHRRTGTMGETVNLIKIGQLLEEDLSNEV